MLGTARLVGLLEMLLGKTEGATYLVRSVKQRPGNILSVGPVSTQIFSSILASSSDFTFNGKTYNLNRIVPNGLTNYHLASNTVVTSGVADFPLALAFGGGGKQAVRPGAAGEVAGLLGQREAC